ncbi:hypothetical protein BC939DRAFT_501694 [Gamsiella multidivaricata]|uniref:uncharacterized protein n=1 Tax=Gamsiella multidivaricata TaxID=101098 RepID=UPI00221ED46C|nr:uncharacterized protein BC939DRAFT_501694 [Gamsiella multidivaricata]KAI7826511.1 hypothetical protein BC939DRAFT_501694 [Gamsiella multidivaricata]
MSIVSEWIQSCATFNQPSYTTPPVPDPNQQPILHPVQQQLELQQHLEPQQQQQEQQPQPQYQDPHQLHYQLFREYRYQPFLNLQNDVNNKPYAAATLASSSVSNSGFNDIMALSPIPVKNHEYITTDLWPHLPIANSPLLELPLTSVVGPQFWEPESDMSEPAPSIESYAAIESHSSMFNHEIQQALGGGPFVQQPSLTTSYCYPTSFPASIGTDLGPSNLSSDNDQFSAMVCSWPQLCDPTTLSPSSVGSSPRLFSTSLQAVSSSSPVPSVYSLAHSPFLRVSTPSQLGCGSYRSASSTFAPHVDSSAMATTAMPMRLRSQTLTAMGAGSDLISLNSASSSPRSSSLSGLMIKNRASSLSLFNGSSSSESSIKSSGSSPSFSFSSSSTSSFSSSMSSLTCQVCRKRYANNSTLRRHLKIHAYANASSRALACLRATSSIPSSTLSSSSLASSTTGSHPYKPLLCSGLSALSISSSSPASSLSSSSSSSSSSASTTATLNTIQGYNPSSDPDIKKPECVGCNKAFARRDTVILHIKNQKRKWDLLSAMLPTLRASSVSSLTAEEQELWDEKGLDGNSTRRTTAMAAAIGSTVGDAVVMAPTGKASAVTGSGSSSGRKVHRQRRSHPYRMVEKLWHSTLQKKGLVLSGSSLGPGNSGLNTLVGQDALRAKKEDCEDDEDGGDTVDGEARRERQGRDEDEDEDGEGGWPSLEVMSEMDSQTKLEWMMKMMKMPPCWRERKVRLFGAFGVLEERVLQ